MWAVVNPCNIKVMDKFAEYRSVDTNAREVVEFVMEIGERKLGRMTHCVAILARMRDVMREERSILSCSCQFIAHILLFWPVKGLLKLCTSRLVMP